MKRMSRICCTLATLVMSLSAVTSAHAVGLAGFSPVDATFNCIKSMVPHEAVLELYQVHAVTEGTDAQAEVSVRLSENGRTGERIIAITPMGDPSRNKGTPSMVR